jgi:glucose/arabinose dehydrogenase
MFLKYTARNQYGLPSLVITTTLFVLCACQDADSSESTVNIAEDSVSAVDTATMMDISEPIADTGVPNIDATLDSDTSDTAVAANDTAAPDTELPTPDTGPVEPPPGALKVTTVLSGLVRPWAIDFLPDGRMLLTRRTGDLHTVDTTTWTVSAPLSGVPTVWYDGQGGLLDVLADPDFDTNSTIYLCYSEPGSGGSAGTAVLSAQLGNGGLSLVTKIFEQVPKVVGPNHFGCRLQVDPTGALMIGLGERFDYMDDSQFLDNHMGKVVRINTDGSIPSDNPYVGDSSALPEIWSYGHRNIQGMAVHPQTGAVYVHEHGPKGGDEINRPEAGNNYGWPLACYGDHYWGVDIPDDHAGQGFTEPLHYWTPSIAPSGMTFYFGDEFPHWNGNIFVGALAGKHLARVVMDGDEVVDEEQLLTEFDQRFRAVEQGPDGALYVLSDDASNGQLHRLTWE